MKSKLKLSLIADNNLRRATFRKRKGGIMKKLHDLTTLCDVKACAIIYSPYENPAVWPSTEGVQEGRITKETKKLERLRLENRESQLTQFMFDCVKGKMSEYQYDARDLHDLSSHIDQYINQLNARIEILTENGEFSSSFPPPLADAGADLPVIADQDAVQPYIPTVFSDDIQYQNLNLNQNQQEPAQYQAPIDMILDPNQYPFQHDPFMNMLIEYPHQQVGYVGEHAHIPFLVGNHYNSHQLPTVGLTATGHMPSTTTTTSSPTDVSAPYINNHL
ncbi:Transcription factor MADS-box [Arabidopsis suecica]|uniref:Transcription factor MADS-box n=1 Tax=Arabidopsis suecica TaxID=45249 RepID=A0A8T2CKP3_ARASU|nr:Transcription factor MADS-box [Arabidopsis suecica]